jgi:hypothetical protein
MKTIDDMKIAHWHKYRALERGIRDKPNEEDAKKIILYRRLHGAGFFDSVKNKVCFNLMMHMLFTDNSDDSGFAGTIWF